MKRAHCGGCVQLATPGFAVEILALPTGQNSTGTLTLAVPHQSGIHSQFLAHRFLEGAPGSVADLQGPKDRGSQRPWWGWNIGA